MDMEGQNPTRVLDAVREYRGKPPINPNRIEGFGDPGDHPSPPVNYILNPELEPPENELPPSPLIPRKPTPAPSAKAPAPTPDISLEQLLEAFRAHFSLVVVDKVASWKGRPVELSEKAELGTRRIVLGELQRELDADLAATGAKRRPRMPSAGVSHDPSTETPRRRRGRPRGSLLAKT